MNLATHNHEAAFFLHFADDESHVYLNETADRAVIERALEILDAAPEARARALHVGE
jgi:hypothetical protein